MSLTPQHKRILDWLEDGNYHCGVEMTYMIDMRKRVSEMKVLGYEIEGKRCNLHRHDSGVYMRRWVKEKPKYKLQFDPIKNVMVQIPC